MGASLELLAGLLEYPGARFERATEALRADPETICLIQAFERPGRAALEETYTRTFDLNGDTSLYVGHHLFGEDWRRGLFLAGLKQSYRESGFSSGSELPDHLPLLLRFIARRQRDEEREEEVHELLQDCVIPAVSRLVTTLRDGENPYRAALEMILRALGCETPRDTACETMPCKPFSTSPFPILR